MWCHFQTNLSRILFASGLTTLTFRCRYIVWLYLIGLPSTVYTVVLGVVIFTMFLNCCASNWQCVHNYGDLLPVSGFSMQDGNLIVNTHNYNHYYSMIIESLLSKYELNSSHSRTNLSGDICVSCLLLLFPMRLTHPDLDKLCHLCASVQPRMPASDDRIVCIWQCPFVLRSVEKLMRPQLSKLYNFHQMCLACCWSRSCEVEINSSWTKLKALVL